MKRKTNKEFIENAILIHGEKYDYSLVEYVSNKRKIKILCKEHGLFEQTPLEHLKGIRCSKCSGMFKKNNDIFTTESKLIHGSKYDYSLVDYKNNKTKVKIICKKHGEFLQRPVAHLQGQGCYKCINRYLTNEEFIEKSMNIHGNLYIYDIVKYINNSEKVKIICKKHGVFEQTPNRHLAKQGCPQCYGNKKLNREIFIEKSINIHGDKYDYSLVKYINSVTKITIICHKHGKFLQKPNNHLNGKGCSKCKNSKGVDKICRILENNNINYLTEKTIKGCLSVNNNLLRFDIFIPNLNIYIEYDGEQHFMEIKNWGGKKGFDEIKKRDKIKDDFCLKNNINFFRISYKDNIENELNKIIG